MDCSGKSQTLDFTIFSRYCRCKSRCKSNVFLYTGTVITSFWNRIHVFTKSLWKIEFEVFFLCLNHITNCHFDLQKYRLLIIIAYFAKKLTSPSFSMFLDYISLSLPLERTTLLRHNQGYLFQDLWYPMLNCKSMIHEYI